MSKSRNIYKIKERNKFRITEGFKDESSIVYRARRDMDLSIKGFSLLTGVDVCTIINHEKNSHMRMSPDFQNRFNKAVPERYRIFKYYEAVRKGHKEIHSHRTCKGCGELFSYRVNKDSYFCSISCAASWNAERRHAEHRKYFLCNCGNCFSRSFQLATRHKRNFCNVECYKAQKKLVGQNNLTGATEITKEEYEMRQLGIDEVIVPKRFETQDQAIERTIAAYNKKGREGIKPTQAIKEIVEVNTGKWEVVD